MPASKLHRFVETTPRLKAKDVARDGDGRPAPVEAVLVADQMVKMEHDAWQRAWFICPRCGKRRMHLYLPEGACRQCLDIRRAVNHGQPRALARMLRVIRLRRKMGIDPTLFAPIPKRKRNHFRRYYRIAARVVAEERALAQQLDPERRARERRERMERRRRRPRWKPGRPGRPPNWAKALMAQSS